MYTNQRIFAAIRTRAESSNGLLGLLLVVLVIIVLLLSGGTRAAALEQTTA